MCPEMKFTSSSFGYVKIWCKYLFLCQTSYCQTSKCNKFWNHWVLYEIWVISSINSYTMYNIHFGNLVQFNIDQVVDNVHLFTGVWVACVGIEPSKKLEEIDHVMMHLETFVLFELETKKNIQYIIQVSEVLWGRLYFCIHCKIKLSRFYRFSVIWIKNTDPFGIILLYVFTKSRFALANTKGFYNKIRENGLVNSLKYKIMLNESHRKT